MKHYYWQPDTCGCKVCQIHDPNTDTWDLEETYTNPRGEVFTTIRCSAHADLNLVDLEFVLMNWDGEHKRKNRIQARLQEVWPNASLVSWSWTGTGKDRVITVVTAGMTANQKATAQTWCDTNLGVGKVIVT